MGRFDALLNSPAPQSVPALEIKARKPANPQVDKPSSPLAYLPIKERVEKYTTRLEPSIIKQIKIYAAENDMADYEVVKRAIKAFLEIKK